MRLLGSRIAGLAAAVGATALALMGGPGTANAATPVPWHIVAYPPASLSSVAAPAKNDAWAVGHAGSGTGTRPLIMNWTGGAWHTVTVPGAAHFEPDTVQATAANNVWVFGSIINSQDVGIPTAFIYNGSSWRSLALPHEDNTGLGSVWVMNSTSAWYVGSDNCWSANLGSCTTKLWHSDGFRWTSTTVRGLVDNVTGNSSHVWFLGLTRINGHEYAAGRPSGLPVTYVSFGTAVRAARAPGVRIMEGGSLAAAPNGQLWLIGSLDVAKNPVNLFHWTGSTWTQASIPGNVCPPGFSGYCPLMVSLAATYDGKAGIWAGPDAHWTGTQWQNTYAAPYGQWLHARNGNYTLDGVAPIPGTSSAWAVGAFIAVYGSLP